MPKPLFFALLSVLFCAGCGTTTQRLATEQLLISDAVDDAVGEIDFSDLSDQDIFLDTRYLLAVTGPGYANSDYIISSIRERLSAAGCRIHESRDDAKVIVEPRIGALGTDGHEVTYGIPQTGQFSSAAAALSGAPVVPLIPEIAFGKSDKQLGVAKLRVFAYDRETRIAVWQSGLKQSESTSTNTWVLGAGPFQKGSIRDSYRFAGNEIKPPSETAIPKVILSGLDLKVFGSGDEDQDSDSIQHADAIPNDLDSADDFDPSSRP